MTICKECHNKIEGKTCYFKLKPTAKRNSAVCKVCYQKLKNKRVGNTPTHEEYIKWLNR